MKAKLSILVFCAFFMTGCVQYTLVGAGVNTVGAMQVTTESAWNSAPSAVTPASRKDAKTWTKDGLLLDRLMLIPGVGDGEPILTAQSDSAALPVFRADMLPNEIEELVESSIVKLYGEGEANISTSNLRPQAFGEFGGFMFDIEGRVTESPDYHGFAGAFIDEDRLYMVIFLAAQPYYFDKHKEEAMALITSATLTRPTIKMH